MNKKCFTLEHWAKITELLSCHSVSEYFKMHLYKQVSWNGDEEKDKKSLRRQTWFDVHYFMSIRDFSSLLFSWQSQLDEHHAFLLLMSSLFGNKYSVEPAAELWYVRELQSAVVNQTSFLHIVMSIKRS